MASVAPHSPGLLYGAHVRANGIRQHYLRFGGRGPALLLVPGIASPAAMWAFVAARLCEHFDVYVLDVRGRGLSEAGEHLDYGLDACAQDVVAFADRLRLSSYTILGHSMGARIAIRAARARPAGLARIVLADPPVSGPGRRPYPSPLPALLELIAAARRGEVEDLLRATPSVWPEPQLLTRAEWLSTCDERAVTVTHRGFHEDDIHADLPGVAVPAALIVAGKGGVIRPEDEQEIRALLPSIAIRRVENAGHQMQIDDLEGLLAALGDVLGVRFSRPSTNT
ncbi:alpha/beta hydrolase [Bradyrhizobium sp. NP1]|uniref:alpha/beta fold hydrolase n=1 Tax=Bradyrhizobium sp. NP1 TaxID=3049772 RepID=UPI0025A5608E|nr:alpha/beta hydrolase [Bradyrhizobium sp. NP1]WJR79900.1 alpha/beta hydrolase [Bradyrhizobium sp. NP1]